MMAAVKLACLGPNQGPLPPCCGERFTLHVCICCTTSTILGFLGFCLIFCSALGGFVVWSHHSGRREIVNCMLTWVHAGSLYCRPNEFRGSQNVRRPEAAMHHGLCGLCICAPYHEVAGDLPLGHGQKTAASVETASQHCTHLAEQLEMSFACILCCVAPLCPAHIVCMPYDHMLSSTARYSSFLTSCRTSSGCLPIARCLTRRHSWPIPLILEIRLALPAWLHALLHCTHCVGSPIEHITLDILNRNHHPAHRAMITAATL